MYFTVFTDGIFLRKLRIIKVKNHGEKSDGGKYRCAVND